MPGCFTFGQDVEHAPLNSLALFDIVTSLRYSFALKQTVYSNMSTWGRTNIFYTRLHQSCDISSILFQVNPEYDSTFMFENDFPALQPDAPDPGMIFCHIHYHKTHLHTFYHLCIHFNQIFQHLEWNTNKNVTQFFWTCYVVMENLVICNCGNNYNNYYLKVLRQ